MRKSIDSPSITADLVDLPEIVRDPKDNHVIAAAIEEECSCIITGDNDLLELGRYNGIEIITPAGFLKLQG